MDGIEVIEYENDSGKNQFGEWMRELSQEAYVKVFAVVSRMKRGNFGDVKHVGDGVREPRIDWGPGLRIYFGKDGSKLVVLLGGGTKRRQDSGVKSARKNWAEYKPNKRKKENNGKN